MVDRRDKAHNTSKKVVVMIQTITEAWLFPAALANYLQVL